MWRGQVAPVAAVEIEVSLEAYEQKTKDGGHFWRSASLSTIRKLMHIHGLVIATCKELGIAVIAYSYALFFLSPPSPPSNRKQPTRPWITLWPYQKS